MGKRLNWDKKYQMWHDVKIGQIGTTPTYEENPTASQAQRTFLKKLGAAHWNDPHLTKDLASQWITALNNAKTKTKLR